MIAEQSLLSQRNVFINFTIDLNILVRIDRCAYNALVIHRTIRSTRLTLVHIVYH